MRAAMLQMHSGIDPAANVAAIVDALHSAKAADADMLFTPEMAVLLDRKRDRAAPHIVAEGDSRPLAELCNAAAKAGLWLHIGSMAVASDDPADPRHSNRSYVIDATGRIAARYDKMHLFDVTLATGEAWRESAAYRPGAGPVLVETPWAKMGLSVCYDLRFPALYAAYAEAGAEILLIPAAFTRPTGAAHWHSLMRARAIETGCFVLAAAQVGNPHADGRATYGHSVAVDPWGTVLTDMGGETPGLAIIDLDLSRIAAVRAEVPSLANRRVIGAVTVTR